MCECKWGKLTLVILTRQVEIAAGGNRVASRTNLASEDDFGGFHDEVAIAKFGEEAALLNANGVGALRWSGQTAFAVL